MEFLKRIIFQIRPSKEEEKKVKLIINQFKEELTKIFFPLKVKILVGGSFGKGTWLSGKADIDLFILFDYQRFKDKSHQLSDLLEDLLEKKFEINRLKGSRDYFKINYRGLSFEIVPVLGIRKPAEALNITDLSPFHLNWVKKNSNEKLRDEIRLGKRFCQANECYGAESYIQGFSGYALEILIIYYQGFLNFLKNASLWSKKEIIDPLKSYSGKEEVLKKLNPSKLSSPLVLVDPVDKTRNVTAALSREKFDLFKKRAKEFLKKPSHQFFVKKEIDFSSLKDKKNLFYLEVENWPGKEDVVGAKLLKLFNQIKKRLKDFGVLESGWDWDKEKKAVLYFVLEKNCLPERFLRKGPPVKAAMRAKAFQEKHPDCFERKGFLFAEIKRKNYLLRDFVEEILALDFIKDKFKKIIRREVKV